MTDRNVYLEDLPLDEVWQRLEHALTQAKRWQPIDAESVPLTAALGRITAEPVWAKISSPHYHAAAMDGYAVMASDTQHATETRPIILKLDEQTFPVNTGNPLPPNTNAVIMIEHVQQPTSDNIEIRASIAPWQYVRMMGEDMVATELVLPANHKIRPVDLGAIAGCGHHAVSVRRKPQVILIPTGSELIPANQTPQAGEIIEYNSLVLGGQIIEHGGAPLTTAIVPDELPALTAALENALRDQPDLVLMLSGSSAGSTDYTASVIQNLGELLVHGVAVRPGHPVIMGIVQNTLVIGVPGYPVSAALTGEIFIVPLLARWLGLHTPQAPHVTATMTRKITSHTGDDDFVRVTLAQVEDRLLATPLSRGAGVITSLVRADGLAHIPRFSEGIDLGQSVNILLYRSLDEIHRTLMIIGSHDPMLDLLGQFLATRFSGYRLSSAHVGSMGGLIALRRREAHLAGTHLLDENTGAYNHAFIKQYIPERDIQLITFAHREQGLVVAKGNPLNIQSLNDLRQVRYVNRQRGSGTRVLLDYELKQHNIVSADIDGYQREEYTHLGVAAAVASGSADCGLALRRSATALDLDFISIAWERYDFAVPTDYLDLPIVQHLLTLLNDAEFQDAMRAQVGYDAQDMGKITLAPL